MNAIIVTTPIKQRETAAQEAQACIKAGGGFYFRRFNPRPKTLHKGTRVFYAEAGQVRGFAVVKEVREAPTGLQCGTAGSSYPPGFYAIMPADSWKWVRPIPYKGFQGWRYFDSSQAEVVGGWLDPMPK